jgi:hypothetical protein
MFEKTSRLAEQVASSVSRREILGSFGRWAATAALGVAGVLTGAGTARADRGGKTHNYWCCYYGAHTTCAIGKGCPPTCCGYNLLASTGPFVDSTCDVCGIGTTGCPC